MHTVPLDTIKLQKRKQHMRSMLWSKMDFFCRLKEYIPGCMLMIFFGLADCYTLSSPFGLCILFAAMHITGKPVKGSIAGVVMLFFMRMAWGLPTEGMKTVVYILAALFAPRFMKKRKQVYILLLVLLCIVHLPGGGKDAENLFRKCGSIALGMSIMPALLRGVELMHKKTKDRTEDDAFCLCVPAMIVLCGAVHIRLFVVNIGLVLAGLMVVSVGWMGGGLLGAVAGMGAGFAVMLGGQHAMYMVFLPMAGFLCGCFRERKRLITAGVYGCTSLALIYITLQQLPEEMIINIAVTCVLFILMPSGKMKRWKKEMGLFHWMKARENAFLRFRMQQWVQHIRKLSEVLPVVEIPVADMEEESEMLTEQLCDQCDRLPICWHEQYDKTRQGVYEILSCPDISLQAINRHFDQCERLVRIPGILEGIYRNRKQVRSRNQAAAYDRAMMETHLLSLSQSAQLISLEGMRVDDEESEWRQRVEEGLEKMHFSGSLTFIKKVDGHLMAGIQSDLLVIQPSVARRIAVQTGRYLGTNMEIVEQGAYQLILEETPLFDLITGQATISAAVKDKGEMLANGDAVMVRPLSGGRFLFALSDGMGHGIKARNESRRTLEMLSVCLQAGYTSEQTMKVVNGAMLSATGGEAFATLDMAVVDLWTGETEMNKLGACSSFIIQGQKINRLSGEALPLGILEHILPAEKNILLEENDRVLMMSDGVADMFETDDDVIHMIQKYSNEPPQTMAESILQEALERQYLSPADDMTVLCVQMVLRYPARQNRKSIPA